MTTDYETADPDDGLSVSIVGTAYGFVVHRRDVVAAVALAACQGPA